MTSVSKNIFTDKLEDMAHKQNNTNHRTIKMKPVNKRSSTDFDFNKENNNEDPKFKGGKIRI